jgi:hypothetical protein
MTAQRASSPHAAPVRVSRAVLALGALIATLVLVSSLTGILQAGGPGLTDVTTVRGDSAQLLGQGLYRHDTTFNGAGFRGTDFVNVFLGVPALIVCLVLYRRGSPRAALALTGVVTYFLYVYANVALGAAYNPLFLLYAALLSTAFYALVLLLRSIDLDTLGRAGLGRLPRRLPGVFFIVAGVMTAAVWLLPLAQAQSTGMPPARMDTYTTLVTYALDLALIVPACFIAARLLLRRAALGYLVAASLLGVIIFLGPNFVVQTLLQIRAGVDFTAGEVAGPIGGFGAVAVAALVVTVAILRRLPGRATVEQVSATGEATGSADTAQLA